MRHAALLGIALMSAGCALKGDVRRVEAKVDSLRIASARADQARAAAVDSLADYLFLLDSTIADAQATQQLAMAAIQADMRGDLVAIRQQLVQIQELTGQSQQRLTELRQGIERTQRVVTEDSLVGGGAEASAMFDASLRQLRRGSLGTARAGFQQFLATYADDERVPDALYHIASTFRQEADADSAAAYYLRVADDYPGSDRVPAALFDLGASAERRGDAEAAREYYARLIEQYPNSPEANLARSRRPGR